MSQYNGIGNPFPTEEQFNRYLNYQKERKTKKYNLVKFYRYDIPDHRLDFNTLNSLVNENLNIKMRKAGGLSYQTFKRWQDLHKNQERTTFEFPKITDKKMPTKDCSWLIFKYKDIIGELKIDIDTTKTLKLTKPHYSIDMVKIAAARNESKHRGEIYNFKTWPGVTKSESGEAVILMALLGKLFSEKIGGEVKPEVERLHWHGTLSSYWTRKDLGKCWIIPGLCEEDYGKFRSREEQTKDIQRQMREINSDETKTSNQKRDEIRILSVTWDEIFKMYRFNSQVLYYWAKNFLRKWDENFSRIVGGEPYKKILKDITEELVREEKGKDKLVRRKIVTEGMPCICKTKRQRGAGRKRKTRKRKKRKRKSTRKKKRKKN